MGLAAIDPPYSLRWTHPAIYPPSTTETKMIRIGCRGSESGAVACVAFALRRCLCRSGCGMHAPPLDRPLWRYWTTGNLGTCDAGCCRRIPRGPSVLVWCVPRASCPCFCSAPALAPVAPTRTAINIADHWASVVAAARPIVPRRARHRELWLLGHLPRQGAGPALVAPAASNGDVTDHYNEVPNWTCFFRGDDRVRETLRDPGRQ